MAEIIGDIDELITSVKHAARAEASAIQREGEERAEETRREQRRAAKRAREEVLERARGRVTEIRKQQRVELVRENRRRYLEVREELLDQVWEQAEERLRALVEDEDAYAETLHQLALAGVKLLGAGKRLLASDERGQALLTKKRLDQWSREATEELGSEVTLEATEEPADTWGGLVIMDEDRRRRVDATFAARLELSRDELRERVFSALVQS
jgi:V-type H+-transporting ATPase subunit E